MATLRRYIASSRLGGPISPAARETINTFVTRRREAKHLRSHRDLFSVLLLTQHLADELAAQAVELLIEDDRRLQLYEQAWLPFSSEGKQAHAVRVRVVDDVDETGVPRVTLIGHGAWLGASCRAETDGDGYAVLAADEPQLTSVIALPRDTYWSRVERDLATDGDTVVIRLKRLLVTGAYDWGHRLMGFRAVNHVYGGAGIRIAIVDSGVSNRSEDVRCSGGRSLLEPGDESGWTVDDQGHGTAVAGVVAALNNAVGVVGGASAATIYALKVFPGGYVSDLVEAIDWSIENRVDIVNVSLGSPAFSVALANAVNRAYLRGVTCVCAAGNARAPVAHPAALPQTVAVTAIGRAGTFPEDSAHQLAVSNLCDRHGGLFAASFNNFGLQVDVCAPGVAILSTVPGGYAALDGTSMACGFISAFTALLLEAYPSLRTADATQVEALRYLLRTSSIDLGMPPHIQGAGMPFLPYALSHAAAA